MVYSTKELLASGETQRSIKRKVESGELFLLGRGIYSTNRRQPIDEAYLSVKYPHAVLTGYSAFSHYDLTDGVPEFYYLATPRNSPPIKNKEVHQSYQESETIYIGAITCAYKGNEVRIYGFERTLIELFRLQAKWPSDLYFEVLGSFRKKKGEIDFAKVNMYLRHFKNGVKLLQWIKEAFA